MSLVQSGDAIKDKMKYLILSNLDTKKFVIEELKVLLDLNTSGKIAEYEIDLKFDYVGPVSEDFDTFPQEVGIILNKLEPILTDYIITSDGKIKSIKTVHEDILVMGPTVWKLDFAFDERFVFHVGVRVDLEV